jgi:hypothetical protein
LEAVTRWIHRAAVVVLAAWVILVAYQVGRAVGREEGAREADRVCYCGRR